ncbi:hypothetical protein MRBLMZ1_001339 [Enterobacter ludwigii]
MALTCPEPIVLGGEVAKYLGLDINHDLLIGFLLTFASSTDVQRKTWLSNWGRARENESLRKEQRNKNYIKNAHEKDDIKLYHESGSVIQPDTMTKILKRERQCSLITLFPQCSKRN